MSTVIGLFVSLLATQADPTPPPPPPAPAVYKCQAADGSVAWLQKPCPPRHKELKSILVPQDTSEAKDEVAPEPKSAPESPKPASPPLSATEPAPRLPPESPETQKKMVYVPMYNMWVPADHEEVCREIEAEAQRARQQGNESSEAAYERNRRREANGC